MSSKFVRDSFETAFVAAFPALNLQDASNDEPERKTLPAQWTVIDYAGNAETRESLGETACRRETGTISPVVFVKAGSGDDTSLTLVESIRAFFRDWKDPTLKITITEVSPPDIGGASDGRWFAASSNLLYTYDQYI